MSDYKNLNDQELEELRVKVRDEQLSRNNRARIEGDLIKKFEEFTNAGGDVQNVFDKFTAEPPVDEPETDKNDEDVENIFQNGLAEDEKISQEISDTHVKFNETAPPVLEAVETDE